MRGIALKTVLAVVVAGSSLFMVAQASAHDRDDWERWEHRHHGRGHWREHEPRRVVVERPVYVAPPARPVYVAPVMPMVPAMGYGQPADPSVNFNFSFPMR